MRYVSTRGAAPALDFEGALLAGLAADGGLYLPETWPRLGKDEFLRLSGLSYADAAAAIVAPFVGSALAEDEVRRLAREAYAGFDHRAVAPLTQVGPADWLLELFHGPTLAFKDYALQLVGRLFDHVLARRGETVTIVGATSGDTGSAAIEACRDRARIRIFILHPKDRVSEVQRRQMTTVLAGNVSNIAIEGSFDDCQDLVKAMFADRRFRDEMRLAAVNSINWARVMAQIVYYVTAAVALGAPDRAVAFAVPTGNFGNVFAGYAASRMGLPVARLVVGSNRNDILTRFFQTGRMEAGEVHATLSPSMDIQVSSNFERLLFELLDRDGRAVADLMERFRRGGTLNLDPSLWHRAREIFDAARFDDNETLATIAQVRRDTGVLLDPHSAIGVAAGAARRPEASVPLIALATAHPAKFPDAVERATGTRPALPPRLADLHTRPERMTILPNDLAAVEAFIRGAIAEAAA